MNPNGTRASAAPPAAPSEAVSPQPALRKMTIIAQDPSVPGPGGRGILTATVAVPAEGLIEGPTGYRVQVVDYDASASRFNGVHELPASFEDEPEHWRAGSSRLVDDFRFHAQNVYALVMRTLARFELALGRRIGWSFKTHQLKVAPHGMLDANAFYSPREEGLVFGYFPGKKGDTVYTCLSHDVVVHETTHALIDALRERYMDPSSPDQAAFHEGLADVVALLSVFAQPEILRHLLTPPNANKESPPLIDEEAVSEEALRESALFALAEQMGEEIQGARGEALRQSARLDPIPEMLSTPEFLEAHRRGEVFVAAVLRAFIATWAARIKQLGIPGQDQYTVARVAEEGADIAEVLLTLWIRALDYMPPVHLTFPDALSAALTGDDEARPDDSRFELRRHLREAFRTYGIFPAPNADRKTGFWRRAPGGLDYDRVRSESMRSDKDEVFRFLWENRDPLGIGRGAYTEVLSVRPCQRIGVDGFVLRETVAEYYQVARLTAAELAEKGIRAPAEYLHALRKLQTSARKRAATKGAEENGDGVSPRAVDGADDDDVDAATTPLYGGGVLIFDEYGRLKYHVSNNVFGKSRQAERLAYLWESGQLEPGKDQSRLRVSRLSTIHRLRALDARRFPREGW